MNLLVPLAIENASKHVQKGAQREKAGKSKGKNMNGKKGNTSKGKGKSKGTTRL